MTCWNYAAAEHYKEIKISRHNLQKHMNILLSVRVCALEANHRLCFSSAIPVEFYSHLNYRINVERWRKLLAVALLFNIDKSLEHYIYYTLCYYINWRDVNNCCRESRQGNGLGHCGYFPDKHVHISKWEVARKVEPELFLKRF